MKKLLNLFAVVIIMALTITGCNDDDVKLGTIDVSPDELVEGIAFSVTPDAQNPNIIYLESKMGSNYTPLWEHPQGRSQEKKVTLKIPFDGTYSVTFGVMTRGGVVYGEPYSFKVNDFCADFVNDDLWTYLTGGVGESKTWIYNNGEYGMEATGEVAYADPSTTVEWGNFSFNWDPGKGWTGDANIWGSEMTFKLDGGAFVNILNTYTDGEAAAQKTESGTFMLDVDAKTLSFTDCTLMHTVGWDHMTTTSGWSKGLKILTLTENFLQVAVLRDKDTSGEDPWWLVWNYVSKDWADNYVPEDKPDPVPEIDGDPNDVITTTRSKSWQLSSTAPYDWANLDGGLLNNFTDADSYLSSGWAAYDEEMIAATKFVFTSSGANSGKYTFSSYGNDDIEGEYTIDTNNDIAFDQALNALISYTNFGWDSNMYLTTSAENKLRILKTKTDVMGNVTDMWLACRSAEKDEYMVYHFEVGSGGAPQVDPVKVLTKRISGESSLTYKADLAYPFAWAYKVGSPSTSYSIKPDEAFPDWTGWNPDAYQYVEKVRFTFNADGTMTYINPAGESFTATYKISDGAKTYGVDIIQFNELDAFTSFCYTGPSGWVGFGYNENPDGALANAPTTQGWFELYSWEYDEAGKVSGLWLGMIDQDGDIANGSNLEAQRKVFHFVVE